MFRFIINALKFACIAFILWVGAIVVSLYMCGDVCGIF